MASAGVRRKRILASTGTNLPQENPLHSNTYALYSVYIVRGGTLETRANDLIELSYFLQYFGMPCPEMPLKQRPPIKICRHPQPDMPLE